MTGLRLLSLAWRNLWRQRRRTVLTLLSIAFGGFLAVLMTAMQDRSFADFIDNAAKLGTGHVTVQNPEYQDRPTATRTVQGTDVIRQTAEDTLAAGHAVDRTAGQAMLATASDSFGAFFIAYDPSLETEETFIFDQGLVEGEVFQAADDRGVVLGEILARNLGAALGDKIVFTLTDRSGEIVTSMERLSGTVRTGAASTDAALVLLPIDSIRKVLGYDPTESTQVAVFLDDGRRSLSAARSLGGALGSEVAVLTWDEIQPFVAMKVGGSRVMEIVIALLVAAGIFNTVFMSVLERGREFGIMIAIGYTPAQLFTLVMFECGLLGVMGLAAAFLLSVGPYLYLSEVGIDLTAAMAQQGGAIDIGGVMMDPILRIGIFPENAAIIAGAIVLSTVLAGVYPAWKAGRVDPVEAINVT